MCRVPNYSLFICLSDYISLFLSLHPQMSYLAVSQDIPHFHSIKNTLFNIAGDIRWVRWLREKKRAERSWVRSPLLTKSNILTN